MLLSENVYICSGTPRVQIRLKRVIRTSNKRILKTRSANFYRSAKLIIWAILLFVHRHLVGALQYGSQYVLYSVISIISSERFDPCFAGSPLLTNQFTSFNETRSILHPLCILYLWSRITYNVVAAWLLKQRVCVNGCEEREEGQSC